MKDPNRDPEKEAVFCGEGPVSPSTTSPRSSVSDSGGCGGTAGGSHLKPPPMPTPTRIRTGTPCRRSGSREAEPYEDLSRALTPDAEAEAEHVARERISHSRTATSVGSTASRMPEFEVVFDEGGGGGDGDGGGDSGGDSGDSPPSPSSRPRKGKGENPRNWPLWYRAWVIFCVSFSTWVVVLHSTCYIASIPGMKEEFGVASTLVATLGVTSYLFGLAAGSLVVAPMSELYGRRPTYILCMAVYTLLIIPTALASSLEMVIVVRFFGALFGAAMISNSPGTVVDISDDEYRALCMSMFSIAPFNGPVTGPLIGGFVFERLGWRWDNWIVLILAGVAAVLMATVRETYAPAILRAKAARMRHETGDGRWWCRYDHRVSTLHLLRTNLSRPFILFLTEPILWFFNAWISLIYGILYLCFVAYPIVFTQYRGWGPGVSGLAFVGIGIGTMLAIAAEPLIRRMINSHPRDPETGRPPPEASASVMLIGAVLTPLGQLVFSWTCLPVTIHWGVPIAFGIPFGCGNTLCFIYGSNYLAGAYGIYAASALAGNAVIRSVFGGTLPLAGASMYERLTPQWAGTLLGLLEVLMIPVPWALYRYGDKIRARSPVIRQMREDQARNEGRRARQLARALRREQRRERRQGAVDADVDANVDLEEAQDERGSVVEVEGERVVVGNDDDDDDYDDEILGGSGGPGVSGLGKEGDSEKRVNPRGPGEKASEAVGFSATKE